jgi:hypothetical protein
LLFYFLLGQEKRTDRQHQQRCETGSSSFWWKLFFYSYTDRSTEMGMRGGRGG